MYKYKFWQIFIFFVCFFHLFLNSLNNFSVIMFNITVNIQEAKTIHTMSTKQCKIFPNNISNSVSTIQLEIQYILDKKYFFLRKNCVSSFFYKVSLFLLSKFKLQYTKFLKNQNSWLYIESFDSIKNVYR